MGRSPGNHSSDYGAKERPISRKKGGKFLQESKAILSEALKGGCCDQFTEGILPEDFGISLELNSP